MNTPSNGEQEERIQEIENEELSFSELFSSVLLNEEIVITIPKEEVIRVKNGLKNLKAKQSSRMRLDGLAPDPSVFSFLERTPKEKEYAEDFIDLTISLSRKSVVKIAKIRIPDNEL